MSYPTPAAEWSLSDGEFSILEQLHQGPVNDSTVGNARDKLKKWKLMTSKREGGVKKWEITPAGRAVVLAVYRVRVEHSQYPHS